MNFRLRTLITASAFLLTLVMLTSCVAHGGSPKPIRTSAFAAPSGSYSAKGKASFYGPGFDGRKTANGEIFSRKALTAAHKSLPFGTRLRVTNLANNRTVIVRVNDRFGGKNGRLIDLSEFAFASIADPKVGIIDVQLDQVAN